MPMSSDAHRVTPLRRLRGLRDAAAAPGRGDGGLACGGGDGRPAGPGGGLSDSCLGRGERKGWKDQMVAR